jgi:peptidoglycan pentaglycine glycine transferase (the first glycine)
MPIITTSEWDQFLVLHPEAHILQSTPWGELKQHFGWKAIRLRQADSGAQILIRRLLPGINLAYIPKGPLGQEWTSLLPEIDLVCKHQRCVFLKIESDTWEITPGNLESRIKPPPGFENSQVSIQPPATLVVDLNGDEPAILGRMKQKTRYNINLALKKGVVIRPSADMNIFQSLMEITAQRDQFGVHNLNYYQRAYGLFHELGRCELLLAEYENNPLAAIIVFAYHRRAWYFYGGSSNQHRDMMPNYLLQWEAMRWARAQGCLEYDLWGVPDADLEQLETQFANRNDGLWGVYRFKRGFGGELRRSTGPWDRVYQPLLYRVYLAWMKARNVA